MNVDNKGPGTFISVHTISGGVINVGAASRPPELAVKRDWFVVLPVRPRALAAVGGISFILTGVGTVASLYSVFVGTIPAGAIYWLGHAVQSLGFGSILLIGISAIVALLGKQLAQSRFASLGGIAFDLSDDGHVVLSRFSADCPRCNGKLRMASGGEHDPSTYFVCPRNPVDHRWRFDYTTL